MSKEGSGTFCQKNVTKKKTKGKQKIQLKYVECPNRRKVTFSKRKTNIIKKVFELHTLTNAQAMVLLASDSGHVYTYATDKLKPMLTSQSGKNLIETCLNTPDESLQIDIDSTNAIIGEMMNENNFSNIKINQDTNGIDQTQKNAYLNFINTTKNYQNTQKFQEFDQISYNQTYHHSNTQKK